MSEPAVDVATFTLTGPVSTATKVDGPLRCASLLKPFFAWVGQGHVRDRHAMLTRSDNAATNRFLAESGGLESVLAQIAHRTGVEWAPASTWGGVLVTAAEVAAAAQALVADKAGVREVVRDMVSSERAQRFGTDEVWAALTGQQEHQLAVKTGWDLHEDETRLRTHTLIVGPTRSVVVLTAVPVTLAQRTHWRRLMAARGPQAVVGFHGEVADRFLVAGLHSAVAALPVVAAL